MLTRSLTRFTRLTHGDIYMTRARTRRVDRVPFPTPPDNAGYVVPYHVADYDLWYRADHRVFWGCVFMLNFGFFSGALTHDKLWLAKNPPNPPHHPDDLPPTLHIHTPVEEDD
eukprot:GHVN01020010.1.p2 GENE.GHVN01020010.1~~GHVN01020010.1.p2  ORF type:complete len:113 (-),score=13.36 GHVN01020010.1:165-503(-)